MKILENSDLIFPTAGTKGVGLTKREYFASQILSALLASARYEPDLIKTALHHADCLIKKLNENE